jgi:hypothetical protein
VNELPKDLSAVDRARWLAQLSEALDAADQLAFQLGPSRIQSGDAAELFMRLTAARAQLKALRLRRPDDPSGDSDPNWSNPPLWPTEPAHGAKPPGEDLHRR